MGNCFLYKRGFGGGFGGGGGGSTPEVEKTASGKVISILDSTEKPLKGLRLFGKTTQNGTPSPTAPVPLVSAGDGGSIGVSVAGKNLVNIEAFTLTMGAGRTKSIFLDKYLPAGVYTVQFMVSNAVLNSKNASLQIVLETGKEIEVSTYGNGLFSAQFHAASKIRMLYFYISSNAGDDATATISNVHLQAGETASDYEPYIEPQTLTLQTPKGLPGIHVSDGGNYTDENGWQWICDEVDFAGGKYVQRVKKVDLTKFQYRNSDGTNTIFSTDAYPDYLKTQGKTLLCSHLPTLEDSAAGVNSTLQRGVGASVFNGSAYAIYITFPTNLVGTSMNDLQAYLIEQENAGTPMELYYPSIEPIETALTSQELAQYAALHTYSPSTTIYNDAGADMEVKYMAKGG